MHPRVSSRPSSSSRRPSHPSHPRPQSALTARTQPHPPPPAAHTQKHPQPVDHHVGSTSEVGVRPRPSAASIIASSIATHLRPTQPVSEMAFQNKQLQALFNMYVDGIRQEDEQQANKTVDQPKQPGGSGTRTPVKPDSHSSAMIAGVKRDVVLLRPKSAHPTPPPPPSNNSLPSDTRHQVAFGRTVYDPAAVNAKLALSTVPISLDGDDDEAALAGGYPGIDSIPVPRSISALRKKTFRDLGAQFDDSAPSLSWRHAAETRGVPLDVDRDQAGAGQNLSKAEFERRRILHLAAAHRKVLDQRPKPWRENDLHQRDARWTSKLHKNQVAELNHNLDDMLRTWRVRQEETNRARYESLPERQPRVNADTGEVEPQLPQDGFDNKDMLYRLVMMLENQMEELKVYNQIFSKITRPVVVPSVAHSDSPVSSSSHPASSPICPSLPLCDLLDRIRHAHEQFYPSFTELFAEIRRRLKFDWVLNELGRRKDHRIEDATREIDQWNAQLEHEQKRSDEMTADLERMKTSLASYNENTYFTAPPCKATMLYDPIKRKLIHLETAEQVDAIAEQPTQWYGELDLDDGDDDPPPRYTSPRKSPVAPTVGVDLARHESRASRKAAKLAARLNLRNHGRSEESRWRAERIAEIRRNADATLTTADITEMRHLEQANEQAKQLAAHGDEQIQVSSTDASDSDSDGDGMPGQANSPGAAASSSPSVRATGVRSRVSRAVARSFTTRPLLLIRPLDTGSKVGGRVFCNSDYYSFDLAHTDPGVWIRLFATEPGNNENHIEMQLACAAPPTRNRRFATTTTKDHVTHCSIDLREFEMRSARDARDAAAGRNPLSVATHPTVTRWYLRVLGRGFSMKSYTLEFRIHTAVIDYSTPMAAVLADIDTQIEWQENVSEKARCIQHITHDLTSELQSQRERRQSTTSSTASQSHRRLASALAGQHHDRRLSQVQLSAMFDEDELRLMNS